MVLQEMVRWRMGGAQDREARVAGQALIPLVGLDDPRKGRVPGAALASHGAKIRIHAST